MPAMPHNMERHPTHPGDYIAYDAKGYAFRCSKSKFGGWKWFATPSHVAQDSDERRHYGDRLSDLATRIAKSEPTFNA